ncbi:MAG: CPBP family intramembrane metalloprotease [Clostridiaceae bacterium]|nr:CPBP family intramembrane metalloprotease [Clostridiaceae bacterium]
MKIKKIAIIMIILSLIQILRILLKNIVFIFVERTLFTDAIVSITFMIIMIFGMLIIIKKCKKELNILPKNNLKIYVILTIILALFIITTPIITKKYSLYNICFLIYGSIITVIFEELIFRGFIWKEISDTKNDMFAYITSTILFGIWHFGYIDTILWRTSLVNPNADILNIMFWKVITGIILGIVFGFFRYKNKNTYSSILLHSFINAFGS